MEFDRRFAREEQDKLDKTFDEQGSPSCTPIFS